MLNDPFSVAIRRIQEHLTDYLALDTIPSLHKSSSAPQLTSLPNLIGTTAIQTVLFPNMPIYLAHGFRWPRDGFAGIRVHAIVNNLGDVSVEYIQNDHSRNALLSSLRSLFPTQLKTLESGNRRLDFLEQYDPEDESPNAVSQPYAFVCDWVVMIAGGTSGRAEHYSSQLLQTQAHMQSNRSSHASSASGRPQSPKVRAKTQPMSIAAPFNSPATTTALSVNIEDITAEALLSPEAWEALAELRDKLAEKEKIGWWVVYNGDPDRDYLSSETETEGEEEEEEEADTQKGTETGDTSPQADRSQRESTATTSSQQSTGTPTERIARPAAERIRSPTGGRMPPPVPPSTKAPRSPTQSASKPLPLRPPQSSEETKASGKDVPPKSPGLRKKIFGGIKK